LGRGAQIAGRLRVSHRLGTPSPRFAVPSCGFDTEGTHHDLYHDGAVLHSRKFASPSKRSPDCGNSLGISVHEFLCDRIARERIYVTEPWAAPTGEPWRSATVAG